MIEKGFSTYAFHLSVNFISWAYKKKPIVSIFSAKEEHVATITVSHHATWLRRIFKYLAHVEKEKNSTFCGNISTIEMFKNHAFHQK